MSRSHAMPVAFPVASDLRGLGRLAIEGITGATDLVEAVHAAIAHPPVLFGRRAPAAARGPARTVYRGVRGITRVVGAGIDRVLATAAPLLPADARSPGREAWIAALNGVLGDHLHASGNPLAIRMQFRRDGVPLPLTRAALAARMADASGRLLVQVHGLCMNDLQWTRASGHDHGAALARAHGLTAVHLHYNSGLRVSHNGRDFASLLAQLVRAWPVPVQEITVLCHSMGGLVARSALEHALRRRLAWARLPLRIVFLGTPHHGAPLERAGSWADLLVGLSPYSAPFARLGQWRSAGIRDLRHGNVRERDWRAHPRHAITDTRTPLPLPAGVRAFAIAASRSASRDGCASVEQARARHHGMRGDGLVPIASALGQHADPAFDLGFPPEHRWIAHGTSHLQLLHSDAVYGRLAAWLADD